MDNEIEAQKIRELELLYEQRMQFHKEQLKLYRGTYRQIKKQQKYLENQTEPNK